MTRHHTHADLVCRALETGKAVFVEKPLALTRDELDRIVEAIAKTGNDRLMVGFNRRFAPLLAKMKAEFGPASSSSVTRYLVNAGPLGADSWYRNEALEGSRFTGEGGHFIDTLSWWADSLPEEVYAVRGPEKDDVQVTVRFAERRRAAPSATSPAATRAYPKETLDVTGRRPQRPAGQLPEGHGLGRAAAAAPSRARGGQDKGQRAELAQFVEAVLAGAADAHLARIPGRHDQGDDRGGREPAERPSGAACEPTRHGSAGTRAGWPGCHLPRWPGAPATRRSSGLVAPAAAARTRAAALPAATARFTAVLPPDTAARVPAEARGASGRADGC